MAKPIKTDHKDLKDLETKPATGMVREPIIGTNIVNMVIVSIFIKIVHYIQNKKNVNREVNIIPILHSGKMLITKNVGTGFIPVQGGFRGIPLMYLALKRNANGDSGLRARLSGRTNASFRTRAISSGFSRTNLIMFDKSNRYKSFLYGNKFPTPEKRFIVYRCAFLQPVSS